jgi:N utilization substance protein B
MKSDKPISSSASSLGRRSTFEAARVARLAAVQALFQIRHSHESATHVIEEFREHRFTGDDYPYAPDETLFKTLVLKVVEQEERLQQMIDAHLSKPWTCATLEPVLREILKAGTLELLDPMTSLPAPVIISEYIDLAKGFLGPTEASLTNAVLDGIARTLKLPLKKDK